MPPMSWGITVQRRAAADNGLVGGYLDPRVLALEHLC